MTFRRLVLRNLFYHWRGNLAVLLGVAVGTAVLVGALLVGDSLRGSLRDLTLEQLGWVEYSLVSPHFVREELAKELNAGRVSPAIVLQGAMTRESSSGSESGTPSVQRAGRITILGVDERFWHGQDRPTVGGSEFWDSTQEEVVLNAALADELSVKVGDPVVLHLQKISAVPRESLLGRRDSSEVLEDVPLRVGAVIQDKGMGRFSLNPTPATPRNAFVPLRMLQERLHQERRVNALLIGGGAEELQGQLRQHLTLDDWGLMLQTPQTRTDALFAKLDRNHDGKLERREWNRRIAATFAGEADRNHDGTLDRDEVRAFYEQHHNYLSLESRQMLLDPAVAEAALAAAQAQGFVAAPTLVYLANTISDGRDEIPYSIVAALDPALRPPLGPFLPDGVDQLKDGEIILADWKESPLHAKPGDSIKLTYFEPELEGRLVEKTATFHLRGFVPLQGAANDPDLTPEFPGITDKLDIRDWNPPFPYDNKRVKPRDEQYWDEYRTTPKAYVTLADGQRLWGSRFGQLTSIRLAPATPTDLDSVAQDYGRKLLEKLDPARGGLVFDPVRARGLQGSSGATNFGGLFLGFSFFLIAAALLLVGLLFRLNLDRRAAETGLLLATGYRRAEVRRLLLFEGAVLAIVGGIIGCACALLYAWLMLELLRAWWPGGLDRSFLHLHVSALSFGFGYVAALIVSLLTIAWAVRVLGRVSPRTLLAGETAEQSPTLPTTPRRRWSLWVAGISTVGALVCVAMGGFVHGAEEQASTFFMSGALLLTAGLAALWIWMQRTRSGHASTSPSHHLTQLGTRNAARHPARSLLTAGLLASATFLVIAVESFYRDPGKDFLDRKSGSGGFSLLGEADVPIYQNLNTATGRDELNFPDRAMAALQNVTFVPFRLHAGDDASCLNLYQPRRPRLLGVPHNLVERGGFAFKDTEARTPEQNANPWLLLEQPREDGAIPVFGEANTVEWMLHSGLGKELTVPNDRGETVRLRVVGLLQDSIFQSELLLSEASFLKLYPREEGYSFFLIEAPPERTSGVRTTLETVLADHGLTVTPTAQRLEAYLAVENTYLATFQALGGLGLSLGALGLAVVLLRSVWERRAELALMGALGFRRSALGWLVLSENVFLLVLGLIVGAVAALVAVAPHLLAAAGQAPWLPLVGLLVVVLVVGVGAGAAALVATLRAPLLVALRRE
jgi:ABC-type antimicrobial peptide transport system permease subunit